MPKSCSYGICKNTTANSSARFFRFPTARQDPDRRKLWVVRCKRKAADGSHWEPKAEVQYIYVCSAHFVTGEPWNHKDHPDYAPSLDGNTVSEEIHSGSDHRLQRFTNRMKRTAAAASQLRISHRTKQLTVVQSGLPSLSSTAVADVCIPAGPSCVQDVISSRSVPELAVLQNLSFSDFHSVCSAISNTFGFTYVNNCDNVIFIKLNCSSIPTVLISLTIDRDFNNSVHVLGRKISNTHTLWSDIPLSSCTVQAVELVLQKLASYSVCSGVNECELLSLVQHSSCKTGAVRKCSCLAGDTNFCNSIISIDCELLLSTAGRCLKCCSVRKRLLMRSKRMKFVSPSNLTSCRKPNSLLTTPTKLAKLAQFARNKRQLTHKVTVLKSKVKFYQAKCVRLIEKDGENLGKFGNSDLLNVVCECKETALSNLEPGSFQRIFFEQQLKYNSLKQKSSMRWHPVIIRWCLFIRSGND